MDIFERGAAQVHFIFTGTNKKSDMLDSIWLNIFSGIHFITVSKSKMPWQVVKSFAFGLKRLMMKPYFLLPCNTFYFLQL